jgi:hypothetical protein
MSNFGVGIRCCWTQATFTLGQRGMKCSNCQKVMTIAAWEEKRRCRCNSTNVFCSVASNNVPVDRINIPRHSSTPPTRIRHNSPNISTQSQPNRIPVSITSNSIFSGVTIFNVIAIILTLLLLCLILICLGAYLSSKYSSINPPHLVIIAGAILGPIALIEIGLIFISFFIGFILGQIPINHDNLALIGLHITLLFGTSLTWGFPIWVFAWQIFNEFINNSSRRR